MLKQQLDSVAETTPGSRNLRKILVWGFCSCAVLLFAALVFAIVINNRDPLVTEEDESRELDHKIAEMWETEEFILSLGPPVARLKHGVLNLKLPDFSGREFFADEFEYNDLTVEGEKKKTKELKSFAAFRYEWSVESPSRTGDPESISIWESFLQDVDYFKHAKFYIVKAKKEEDSDQVRWQAEMGFSGLAKRKDGQLVWVHGSIDSHWQPNQDYQPDDRGVDLGGKEDSRPQQLLTKFLLKEFHTWEVPQTMFSEVLDAVLLDEKALERVRHSGQEEYGVDLFLPTSQNNKPEESSLSDEKVIGFDDVSFHIAIARHPAVAVVDLDRDGFDDIYLMPQWGKNSFLRNRGDGTFEEIAADLGLDIENHCSSAAFADFDNDGDYDLFLGRTLKPSMYLENHQSKFREKPLEALSSHPGLVSSISVADYNKDGLLDVFIANYHPFVSPKHAEQYFDPADFNRYKEIHKQGTRHVTLNRIGPPNRLLVNRGEGRFEIAPDCEILQTWRNSYQATWADYDNDGDPDLYVANDFAPNNFFRNDNGKFVDVTEETGTSDIGFGMGVSWGDYDNDGWQDLYISNMFSKAGRRITEMVPDLDSRIALMARGNSLFRNVEGKKFEKVSGLKAPKLKVEKAGWSWSGQFADFDNNGHLDIYALSGYYTLPKRIEQQFVSGLDL